MSEISPSAANYSTLNHLISGIQCQKSAHQQQIIQPSDDT
ncbi:hypothetical protein RintRC_4941 [Richelia intracellularis]|nr:hypothetical protein RintRC_4941 [Richelia intracellularis]